MDIKSILAFLMDPKILAAVGGWAAYQYLGKKKPGRYQPYLYAGGGAVAGWLLGKAAQNYLVQPTSKQATGAYEPPQRMSADDPRVAELQRMISDNQRATVDLDAGVRLLPVGPTMSPEEAENDAVGSYAKGPPLPAIERRRQAIDAASIAEEDMAILDSAGSYGDSLDGEGLGSFSGSSEIDAAVNQALKEEKSKRGQA